MPNDLITQSERPVATDMASQIMTLAANPDFDAVKLDALVKMVERGQARLAEEQFNAAMTEAQQQMGRIGADAYNPQTKSRYASYAALDRVLRPIYTGQGFGLSFNTAESASDSVRVLCLVTHRNGHSREYRIDMPADGKGAKGGDVMTKTHATGAAVQYGMRYLLKMIFNVAVGEDENDGNTQDAPVLDMPEGFQAWWDDMKATADDGLTSLADAWKQSDLDYKRYITKVNPKAWEDLKRLAATVTR